MSRLVFTPAYQLAHMIRKREVSAVEVFDAYTAQIVKYNAQLNAICTLDESARDRAKLADQALARSENWGVLHGVPIAIKDCLETAELLTTAGYKPLQDHVPQHDATAVGRLRAAGAIVIGKTNLAKLAGDFQSTNDLFPHANNPWNLNYTPGGSSGGTAAAIAAGLAPLDVGSDIGGSIRQPSHFCGVFGLKPTDRRVSTAGHIPEVPGIPRCIRQMLVVGPIARSIEDLRLGFSLIAGADPRQPEVPPIPLDTPNFQNLRLAWTDEIDLYPVAQTIKSALQSVAQKLTDTKIVVEKWVPKFDFALAWQVYFALSAYISPHQQPFNLDFVRDSSSLMLREATAQCDRTFGQTEDGLPIGMQIVGQRWCEMKLLAIAQHLHQIIGAFQQPPGYSTQFTLEIFTLPYK